MDGNKAFALSKTYTDKVSTEIKTSIEEKIPTVPDWAKQDAPTEMSFTDVKNAWNSIFN